MTTEQKIREAFIKYDKASGPIEFMCFRAGYLALLNKCPDCRHDQDECICIPLSLQIKQLTAERESQAAEIEKYKALCDQMGNALEYYQPGIEGGLICIPNGCMTKAIEAWRAMK